MIDPKKILDAARKLEKVDLELSNNFYEMSVDLFPENTPRGKLSKEGADFTRRRLENRMIKGSLNEKIQERIFTDKNYLYTKCSDKYLVRDYVAKRIGSEYLIPLIACVNNADELRGISKLKNCVVKPNNGAGRVKFVSDKGLVSEELENLVEISRSWLTKKYGTPRWESQYLKIEPKIIVEESLCIDGVAPDDYKFHMFKQHNGEFKFVLQKIASRFEKTPNKHTFYVDSFDECYLTREPLSNDLKPALYKCLTLSKILMEDFSYARVDWYVHKEKVYFGELTFTPGAGNSKSAGAELQKVMGDMWVM